MGGAPAIVWLREGVGYVEAAAASMARLEVAFRERYGRARTCNSTYRNYGLQLSMWQAWTAWTEGRGPKPNHSRPLHPDESKHSQGLADDSNEWTTPGYIDLAAEHGWIRTAANDPTEQHHFEYQEWRDNHRNEGWPNMALDADKDYDAFKRMLYRALKWDVRDGNNGPGADAKLGATIWDRLGRVQQVAASAAPQIDYDALAKAIVKALMTT